MDDLFIVNWDKPFETNSCVNAFGYVGNEKSSNQSELKLIKCMVSILLFDQSFRAVTRAPSFSTQYSHKIIHTPIFN